MQEQCKDNKKQTGKHEILENHKNNTQRTNADDDWKMCKYSYNEIKFYKHI